MSPIIGLSDMRRLPRLGKIHLGIKVEEPKKSPYPRATDYFVCPPEVQAIHGEQPKDLPIIFPVDKEEEFAQQWYRCYSNKWGLICKGNGATADRTFDKRTGALAGRDTQETVRREVSCPGPRCPEFQKKQCRPIMNLMFCIPDVPGIGVYQLDTSSRRSIMNINSALEIIRRGCGQVAFLPLTLSLRPEEAQIEGGPKHTIYVLLLTARATLPELVGEARKPFPQVLLPSPTPPSEEEPPEDHFPTEVLEAAESGESESPTDQEVEPQATAHALKPGPEAKTPPRDPESLKSFGDLWQALYDDLGVSKTEGLTMLGYKSQEDISEPYSWLYLAVWRLKGCPTEPVGRAPRPK